MHLNIKPRDETFTMVTSLQPASARRRALSKIVLRSSRNLRTITASWTSQVTVGLCCTKVIRLVGVSDLL